MLLIIWTLAISAAVILYFHSVYTKFSKCGVNCFTPLPLIGNLGGTIFKTEHISTSIQKLYNAFPEDRFLGMYEFINANVLIKDLELIKKITIKDFDHFVDHRTAGNPDPLFGRNLFALKDDEWRLMRAALSPAFTSSKIRLMVPLIVEVGQQMSEALKKKISDSGAGNIEYEVRELTTRYANDVIASCAFGLKIDSLLNENNEFYLRGKEATTFTLSMLLKFFIFITFPKALSKLKIEIFPKHVTDFYIQLVTSVKKEREEKNILRPDMMQLLMDAQKGKLVYDSTPSEDAGFATVEESAIGTRKPQQELKWTDMDLTANAMLFFLAGFDTIATTMSFLMMELAVNPDCQEKLVKEIQNNEMRNRGKFDYRSVQEMVYLDMVVSELLRLWPPMAVTDRMCTKPYNLGRSNSKAEKDYIIKAGEGVGIPIYAIHRSPEYFPNPDKFDPERFSLENRKTINPLTYMPFGLGPRNCIGSRFALCEVKVFVYQLLKDFTVSPCSRTQLPLRLAPDTFNPRVLGGHWLKIQLRK